MEGEKEQADDKTSPPPSPGKTATVGPTDSSSGENGQLHQEQKHERRRRRRNKHNRNGNRSYPVTFENENNPDNVNDVKPDESEAGPKRKRRHRRKHKPYHLRKYKPYTQLTWEERQERDEVESQRATRRRANRPTPYNTTQFLMEDHKAETPDLSSSRGTWDANDSSDEIFEDDFRNGEYLERNFSAVYEEVQSERLESMTKVQLVQEVFALSKRVTELEESQTKLKEEQESQRNDKQFDEKMQAKMDDIQKLQKEVQQLKEENTSLRRESTSTTVDMLEAQSL